MKGTTVRLPDELHALIVDAADGAGISIAAYVREAVLMRYAAELGLKICGGGPPELEIIREGIREVERRFQR